MHLRICFYIGGFWMAWFSCRRVVEMKTRESNPSPTAWPGILRTGRFKKPRRGRFARRTIVRVPEKRKGQSPPPKPLDLTPSKRSFSAPLHGRRIVHLRYLAVGLSACQNPGWGKPLALIDFVEEKRYAWAAYLSSCVSSVGWRIL